MKTMPATRNTVTGTDTLRRDTQGPTTPSEATQDGHHKPLHVQSTRRNDLQLMVTVVHLGPLHSTRRCPRFLYIERP